MHVSELPGPSWSLPLIGDLWRINPAMPVHSELALVDSLGALYKLNMGLGRELVVTTDHNVINDTSDEATWTKFLSSPFVLMRETMTGNGLLTANNSDPLWSKANDLIAPGFSREALVSYHPIMIEAVNQLCDMWETSQGGWVDVSRDMNRLTMEVIARAGFSDTFNALGPESTSSASIVDELTQTLRALSATANSLPILAALRSSRLKRGAQSLRDAATRIVAQHRSRSDSHGHTDLLDRMCPAGSSDALPRQNAVDQCLTFLAAGNETTAGTLAFCLHYLAQDLALQSSVRNEVKSVGAVAGLPYEAISKLRITRRVVDESLRLWPVAPAYFRRARQDTVVHSRDHGPVSVPKNTVVMVLLLGAHRDPTTWGSDAAQFRPDRFDPKELRRFPDRVYRPFGVGPRSCIGRQFAIHEAILTLAGIVERYHLEPQAKTHYQLQADEMITLKPRGLRLKVEAVA